MPSAKSHLHTSNGEIVAGLKINPQVEKGGWKEEVVEFGSK